MRKRRFPIPAIAVVLLFSSPAFCASLITISPSGESSFLIQGASIENAAAIELTIGYDASALANPRVMNGGLIAGALAAVNANTPGMIRMAVIRTAPIQGTGLIAFLTFDSTGFGPGKITSATARLADLKGTPLAVGVQITDPGSGAESPQPDTPRAQDPAPAVAAAPQSEDKKQPLIIGPVLLAPEKLTDGAVADESGNGQPRASETQPGAGEAGREQGQSGAADAQPNGGRADAAELNIYTITSVLDRFRDYSGERTPKALTALFGKREMIGFSQEPPIVLSDGRSEMQVRLITAPGEKGASNISVMGARVLSMKKDRDNTNTWLLRLLPEKGTYRATVAVLQKSGALIFPLTVAPRIAIGRYTSPRAAEAAFESYLKNRRTAKAPKCGLSNDSTRGFLDDYIYTANFLARQKQSFR